MLNSYVKSTVTDRKVLFDCKNPFFFIEIYKAILNIILGNKKIGVLKALNAMKFDLFNVEVLRVIKNIITKKLK